MKFSIKILSLVAILAFAFVGCEDGDKVFDQIQADVQRGAVLRTVQIISDEIPIGQSDSFFGVELEVQDQENGDLVNAIEVFAAFDDNTIVGADLSKSEVMVTTFDRSAFTTEEFGLPRTTYMITLPEMLSALGLADTDVDGGDVFMIRFELVLNDGRRYSFADNSGTLTGSFFSSPFLYNATVVCPPTPPTPGTWTIAMQDSYGDGWNGASLLFTIDGIETSFAVAASQGSEATETFDMPAGTQVLSIKFVSGDWDEEISFQITSASGNTIIDVTPTPVADVELINYCVNNF